MSLSSFCWAYALFIRDDDERLVLGVPEYTASGESRLMEADTIENDIIPLTGASGAILAGQVKRAGTQNFDGVIGSAALSRAETETLRQAFLSFFQTGSTYTVVYVLPAGVSIARKGGYLVDAATAPLLYGILPEYHVALSFQDVNYYTYSEDDDGDEVYTNFLTTTFSASSQKGVNWQTTSVTYAGALWYSSGLVWVGDTASQMVITMPDGVGDVGISYTFYGYFSNPSLTNTTNGTSTYYSGTIDSDASITYDSAARTMVNSSGSSLTNASGWVTLSGGSNTLELAADATSSSSASVLVEWAEVLF